MGPDSVYIQRSERWGSAANKVASTLHHPVKTMKRDADTGRYMKNERIANQTIFRGGGAPLPSTDSYGPRRVSSINENSTK